MRPRIAFHQHQLSPLGGASRMFGNSNRSDASSQLAALQKSQAVIEFNLDGTIITANANFLGAIGYSLSEVQG